MSSRVRATLLVFGLLAAITTPRAAAAQQTVSAKDSGAAGRAVAPASPAVASLAGLAPSHVAAAESLLVAANMEHLMAGINEQMLAIQVRAMPALEPYADIMREFINQQLSWKSLQPEFAALYAQAFSESELRDITAFYRTPLGQKLLEKSPELMRKGAEIGQARMQAVMPQMIARIQERAQELQKQGKLPAPSGGKP